MPNTKKGSWKGALWWKGWIFLATGSVACLSWVLWIGMKKPWKIYMDPFQRKRSHQVRKNDGKGDGPPKKIGWITDRPTCFFCLAPLPICFVHFVTASFKKKPWSNGVTFWECPSPSQWHIKGLGLGPSPTRILTNVNPHPSFRGLRSKAAQHWTWYCSNSTHLF